MKSLIENITEFQKWMYQMLKDSKEKLGLTDETLAELLLKEGIKYYHRSITKCVVCPLKKTT